MLVLTRKVGERIMIGEAIVLTVVRIQNDQVRIGIEAPHDVSVHREEVYRRAHSADRAATGTPVDRAPEADAAPAADSALPRPAIAR